MRYVVLSGLAAGLVLSASVEAISAGKAAGASLAISPEQVRLRIGEGRQFRARLKGAEGEIRWSVEGAHAGSISATGFYQTPPQAATPARFRVIAAAAGNPAARAEALVFVEPVSVELDRDSVTLSTAETHAFRARVKGTPDQRVVWSVEGPECGRISAAGLYTAPPQAPAAGTVTVRATSVADPSKSAATTVRVNGIRVQIEPKTVKLPHGKPFRFTAKVEGTRNTAVEWQVVGKDQGEITDTGLYTPPPTLVTPTEVTVTARSLANPQQSASARIQFASIEVVPAVKTGKKKNSTLRAAGAVASAVVRRVTRIYLPVGEIEDVISGPSFKGKSGKQYLPLGGALQLATVVTNTTNDRVNWEFVGARVGELGPTGFYQTPPTLQTPQVVQVRGTSAADPTKSVLYSIHIPPVIVRPQPETYTCPMGGAVQLQARVQNAEDDTLVWTVEGGSKYGIVTETGLYRPPAALATPTAVRVRATSMADPSKSAVVRVAIPALRIDLSPDRADLSPGQSLRLKAKVTGAEVNGDVLWKVTPAIGTLTPDGVYHAPPSGGPHFVEVTAALKADPTKTATARLRLRAK